MKEKQKPLKSETIFQELIENNADGIIVVNKTGIIHFVNPAAERILGREATELTGELFGFPVVPLETTDINIIHKDGKSIAAEMRTVDIEYKGKKVCMASIRDITDRVRMEEEKKAMEIQLVQFEKMASVGQLAAGIAHEINNPTGFVSSNLKTLADYANDIRKLTSEYRKLFEGLESAMDKKEYT